MQEYTLTYEIQIEAETPEAAVREVERWLESNYRDRGFSAGVWGIEGPDDLEIHNIDTLELFG